MGVPVTVTGSLMASVISAVLPAFRSFELAAAEFPRHRWRLGVDLKTKRSARGQRKSVTGQVQDRGALMGSRDC